MSWRDWSTRLRAHLKEKPKPRGEIAAALGIGEAALRHWLNGTRNLNLEDFFRLCDAAEADPLLILFGPTPMTDEMKRRLGDAVVKVLESDTSANPHYLEFIGTIKKDFKKRTPRS